jgi:hypothetical protein
MKMPMSPMNIAPLCFVPIASERVFVRLAEKEVVAKLNLHIGWGKFVALELAGAQSGELVGKRQDDIYTIARSISYPNIYQPYGRFRVDAVASGSIICLMFYAPFSVVFLSFCILSIFVVKEDIGLLTMLALVCFFHVAGVLLFFWEKEKLIQVLRHILEK